MFRLRLIVRSYLEAVAEMRRLYLSGFLALIVLASGSSSNTRAQAREQSSKAGAGQVDVNRIVRAFTKKETEFPRALNNYTFTRDALIQTIGWGGQVTGEHYRISPFVFNDARERCERL